MHKQKYTAEPFQEGFVSEAGDVSHVFTDYRWNDGAVSRRWLVEPTQVDLAAVTLRPITLEKTDAPDQ